MLHTTEEVDEDARWKRVAEQLIDHPSHMKVRYGDWYELSKAYALLAESIPLALERIQAGGVSVMDQRAFWSALERCGNRVNGLHELDFQHARTASEMQRIGRALAKFYDWLSELAWDKNGWRPQGRKRAAPHGPV